MSLCKKAAMIAECNDDHHGCVGSEAPGTTMISIFRAAIERVIADFSGYLGFKKKRR